MRYKISLLAATLLLGLIALNTSGCYRKKVIYGVVPGGGSFSASGVTGRFVERRDENDVLEGVDYNVSLNANDVRIIIDIKNAAVEIYDSNGCKMEFDNPLYKETMEWFERYCREEITRIEGYARNRGWYEKDELSRLADWSAIMRVVKKTRGEFIN
ncbi:MAG: hypothetical protein DRH12_15145 [Deltaproteobacteria bacterium]|nr:MAG: hypothetical protein DRH12_15145 [Deltaproteobacteria bacterium]